MKPIKGGLSAATTVCASERASHSAWLSIGNRQTSLLRRNLTPHTVSVCKRKQFSCLNNYCQNSMPDTRSLWLCDGIRFFAGSCDRNNNVIASHDQFYRGLRAALWLALWHIPMTRDCRSERGGRTTGWGARAVYHILLWSITVGSHRHTQIWVKLKKLSKIKSDMKLERLARHRNR